MSIHFHLFPDRVFERNEVGVEHRFSWNGHHLSESLVHSTLAPLTRLMSAVSYACFILLKRRGILSLGLEIADWALRFSLREKSYDSCKILISLSLMSVIDDVEVGRLAVFEPKHLFLHLL